jgi:hypothetical protein
VSPPRHAFDRFAATGFKAYFNERAFFRGEARFTPNHDGINQMIWTAGVGIDFWWRRTTGAAADSSARLLRHAGAGARAARPMARLCLAAKVG